jgi:hypothetical protein
MSKDKTPWGWIAALVASNMVAMGAGIGWGEAGKEREFREKIRKQREEKQHGNQR